MVIEFIKLIFISMLIIIIPVYGQWNFYTIIDDSKFSRIKIKKFKCFFKALDFQPVDKHGIIISMFIMQAMSYLLSLTTLIIGTVQILEGKSPLIVSFLILGSEVTVLFILIHVLAIISMKRK